VKFAVLTQNAPAKNDSGRAANLRLPAVISGWLLCLCVLLFPPCLSGDAFAGDRDNQAPEKRAVDLVNKARLKGGRCGSRYFKPAKPVAWNAILAQASHKHSRDMAGGEFMGHTGSDDSRPGDRIGQLGYRWMSYGENVCEGYATPEEAVKAWLKSREHCENIMNPVFREAGAAFARGAGRVYWTLVLATPESRSRISP
jgi:uncharacterized protein YkwD